LGGSGGSLMVDNMYTAVVYATFVVVMLFIGSLIVLY
jgi:hypothetical protein